MTRPPQPFSFPGSAWERTVFEALPHSSTHGRADGKQAEPASQWVPRQSLGIRQSFFTRSVKSTLLACLAIALAAPAAGQEPPREISIYDVARYGVAQKRVRRTEMVGFPIVKSPYVDVPRPVGVLVGFDVGLGPFNDELAIFALRPIFQNAKQTSASKSFGLFQNENRNNLELKTKVTQIVRLLAKPGYAVGEVTLDRGLFLKGMSLRYMKIAGPVLDTSDAYASRWVGSPTGENRATLSGGGSPIVGIHGSLDRDARGLGLIYLDPSVYLGLKIERPSAAVPEGEPSSPASQEDATVAVGEAASKTPLEGESAAPPTETASPASPAAIGVIFLGVTGVVLATLFLAFGRRSSSAASSAAAAMAAGTSRAAAGSGSVPPIVPAMLGVAMQHRMQNNFGAANYPGYPVTAEVVDAVLVD
jgi:hypothetical protein